MNINGKYVQLSTSRRGICEGCSDKSTCSFDTALGKGTPEIITAINSLQAKPGDSVEFDLTGHEELKLSLIVWIIPLIGLIIGALLGATYYNFLSLSYDSGTLLGLVLGFGIAFSFVVIYEKFLANEKKVLPIILKINETVECHKDD